MILQIKKTVLVHLDFRLYLKFDFDAFLKIAALKTGYNTLKGYYFLCTLNLRQFFVG